MRALCLFEALRAQESNGKEIGDIELEEFWFEFKKAMKGAAK